MARSKYNSSQRGARGQAFAVAVVKRQKLFVNFPRNCEISYKWDDESLGKVVNYDHPHGRILTDKGGSHNPDEIKVLNLNLEAE